jgi:hypothetical protein
MRFMVSPYDANCIAHAAQELHRDSIRAHRFRETIHPATGTRFAARVIMMRAMAGAMLVSAGCTDPASDQTHYDDIARLVGATLATSDGGATMGAVNDSFLLAHGVMPAGFTDDNGMISGDHGALAHRYVMIVCRDRENRVIKPCNQMTSTATMTAAWSGAISTAGVELVSNRQGMWTLGNLETWMPTLGGSSSLQTEGTVDDRAYALTATADENMLTPVSMLGGTIHLDAVVTRVADEPFELEVGADIVFDNLLRSAALTLDGAYQYRVDLATGELAE